MAFFKEQISQITNLEQFLTAMVAYTNKHIADDTDHCKLELYVARRSSLPELQAEHYRISHDLKNIEMMQSFLQSCTGLKIITTKKANIAQLAVLENTEPSEQAKPYQKLFLQYKQIVDKARALTALAVAVIEEKLKPQYQVIGGCEYSDDTISEKLINLRLSHADSKVTEELVEFAKKFQLSARSGLNSISHKHVCTIAFNPETELDKITAFAEEMPVVIAELQSCEHGDAGQQTSSLKRPV